MAMSEDRTMIHDRKLHPSDSVNSWQVAPAARHRELRVVVEACVSAVHRAKRAADESLGRLQDAPEPHVATNTFFIGLYDIHQRDRETLFAAMRQLDAAQVALRSTLSAG